MSKIPSLPLQMESLAMCLGSCIFFCSKGGCMFVFWAKYKFGLCIKTWRRGFGCSRLCLYLSKRVSLISRWEFFCYAIAYFAPFWVIKNRVTKIYFKYFMEIVTILVVLVDQFYFCMQQPTTPWLFEKIIFWGSLSLLSFIWL